MKELSIEEKAKAYDEALEKAKKHYEDCKQRGNLWFVEDMEDMFPILKDSKDGRVRKHLISLFEKLVTLGVANEYETYDIKIDDILAWLKEKPKTEKVYLRFKIGDVVCSSNDIRLKIIGITDYCYNCTTTDNNIYSFSFNMQDEFELVKPKFKISDWVIDSQGIVHQIANVIENVTNHTYGYDIVGGGYFNDNTEGVRLWTIQDAKDGDVLHSTGFHNDCIFIFNRLDNWKFDEPNGDRAVATGYCCLSISADKMEFGIQGPDCVEVNTIKPATNIQRNLLEKAMADAGYTFDFEKKELKEIEQKPAEDSAKVSESSTEEKDMGEYKKGFECGKQRVLKYPEDFGLCKKPVWSEEDEEIHRRCICAMRASACGFPEEEKFVEQVDNWLESLKGRVQLQPKQEWSEEDELNLSEALHHIRMYNLAYKADKLDKWLKSLKERVQSHLKHELSEKDYNEIETIACHLDNINNEGMAKVLRSIRDKYYSQSKWKPSEEQFKLLKHIIENVPLSNMDKSEVGNLYLDLKKLTYER